MRPDSLESLNYTVINHNARKRLGLNLNEYCLADLIHNLSNNGKSLNGYCYASKQYMADELGLTKKWVITLIGNLIDKEIVVKHPVTKHLKTTEKWNSVCISTGVQNTPSVYKIHQSAGVESTPSVYLVPEIGVQNTPNNDNTKKFKKIYTPDSPEHRLSSLLYNLIKERDPKHRKPDIQKWADHINKLIRLDGRTEAEIQGVIEWCQKDQFWQSNILSTDKLRSKFDMLIQKKNGMDSRQQTDKGFNKDYPAGSLSGSPDCYSIDLEEMRA